MKRTWQNSFQGSTSSRVWWTYLPLGYHSYQIPFYHLSLKRKGMPLGYSLQNSGPSLTHWALQSSTGLCGMRIPPCLRAITVTALLVKATEKMIVFPLNHFCTWCSRHFPEFSSHSTFLSQHLTSEVLLLISSHITLLCCSNLNLADLFLFVPSEVP